jgi:Cd2+/Zn2+-exporting ATPase
MWQMLLVYLVPYLLIGHNTLHEAIEGIVHGQAFNEHFLMSVATIGALCIGFLPGAESQFTEAVFVMLFFQIGEFFEEFAEKKSHDSITHLMDIRPDIANVERNGQVESVSPEEVRIGEIVIVKPGEKVPIDGVIVDGSTLLNTVALTGESVPRSSSKGDEVISGCINLSGVIKMKTTKSFQESTVSKIIQLVEESNEHKSESERFITRFARVYTPVVVFAAIALAIIPPLLSDDFVSSFSVWLYRALMFLVVSCPCALVISIPLTFFGGVGGASRKGILIKGANFIDVLAKVKTVVLDKTGTLTHGQFAVDSVHAVGNHDLLRLASAVEQFSNHPVGVAFKNHQDSTEAKHSSAEATDVNEFAGCGIQGRVGKQLVCVGNVRMMEKAGVTSLASTHPSGVIVHVAVDGTYAGYIVINDKIREESADAIKQLQWLGIERTVMLTGDRKEPSEYVARQLQLNEYHAELLPTDKVSIVSQLLGDKSAGSYLAFVGDGINDAPVLARADVGIAMGGLGSDAAIEAADVVLMDDNPTKIALAIRIARRTLAIARQNVWFAIGIKIAVLILAALGLATMWMAVFADVGITVLAVLNAMRALTIKTS